MLPNEVVIRFAYLNSWLFLTQLLLFTSLYPSYISLINWAVFMCQELIQFFCFFFFVFFFFLVPVACGNSRARDWTWDTAVTVLNLSPTGPAGNSLGTLYALFHWKICTEKKWSSFVAQLLTNPTRTHEDLGFIPGLDQRVKDLVLPWAVMWITDMSQIPSYCGCSVGQQLQLRFNS